MLLAMLLAQALGLWHGISELDPAHHDADGRVAAPAGSAAQLQLPVAWFGDHEEESDCRLFDQASRGDCVSGVLAAALPPALPASVQVALGARTAANGPASIRARGPPPSF